MSHFNQSAWEFKSAFGEWSIWLVNMKIQVNQTSRLFKKFKKINDFFLTIFFGKAIGVSIGWVDMA